MIRKAREDDIEGILEVLSYYNFKVVEPRDGFVIVDPKIENFSIYNEVSELNLNNGFVAELDGKIVGFSHYKHYQQKKAKTTLITVNPHFRGHEAHFGSLLQHARMEAAFQGGYEKIVTFCDNEPATKWYIKHFKYKTIGQEDNHHRLHFIPLKDRIIWGVHYGFYDNLTSGPFVSVGKKGVTILEADLKEYLASK